MLRVNTVLAALVAVLVLEPFSPSAVVHGQKSHALLVSPMTSDAVRAWDGTVDSMVQRKELAVRARQPDALIPGRTIERLDQYFRGVRVWGADLTRQFEGSQTVSIFGLVYEGIDLDPNPSITQEQARTIVERIADRPGGLEAPPELVVLPTDAGSFVLAWVGDIGIVNDRIRLFIDAKTGEVARRDSLIQRQAPNAYVGHGTGVFGDDKKVSTNAISGGYVLFDTLRPPDISTFDMRSNLARTKQILMGVAPVLTSDYGFSSGNEWSDPALVDAHVNSSYTYDYYYKRFGRHGLDNADKHIWNFTHAVRREDAYSATLSDLSTFWVNAFYNGNGVMFYGEGLPSGVYLRENGHWYNYFSGALDIVAHELTHGVTDYTSRLEYRNESGALNEAFSDIMATSVEFYFQAAGTGSMRADYSIGEDISIPMVSGAPPAGDRSMANPGLYGDPDHYSKRYTGSADNGGVHTNSGIPNQAFYLAIEGGTNRTSGTRVTGLGSANRDQIEKVFYRAFTQLMPSNATFSMARSVTLRAAQDLYGSTSGAYNAVRDAWTAVGVN
jgi:bacillolysin